MPFLFSLRKKYILRQHFPVQMVSVDQQQVNLQASCCTFLKMLNSAWDVEDLGGDKKNFICLSRRKENVSVARIGCCVQWLQSLLPQTCTFRVEACVHHCVTASMELSKTLLWCHGHFALIHSWHWNHRKPIKYCFFPMNISNFRNSLFKHSCFHCLLGRFR